MKKMFILILLFISVNCFSDAVSIGEQYLNLQWVVKSDNVLNNYTTTNDPHQGYTTAHPCDWINDIDSTFTGMPYHYGGKDSITQWDNDYSHGEHGPGADSSHYSQNPPSSLFWAAGIDCSGFVGRCWEIPESDMPNCGCGYLINHSHNITAQQVQPGDAFIRTANAHARLCYYRIETDPQ